MESRAALSVFFVIMLLSPLALPLHPIPAAKSRQPSPHSSHLLQIGSDLTIPSTIRLVAYPWGTVLTDLELTFATTQGAAWEFNSSVLSITATEFPIEVNISLFPGEVYRTIEMTQPVANDLVEINASRVSVSALVDGSVTSGESVDVLGNGNAEVANFPSADQDQVFYLAQGTYLVTATLGNVTQTDQVSSETGKVSSVVFDFQVVQRGGGPGLWDYLLLASGLAGATLSGMVWVRVYRRRGRPKGPRAPG